MPTPPGTTISLRSFRRGLTTKREPAKLVERLKDPATREKIRKDMLTPSKDWDNEWQEIPSPDAVK